MPNRKILIVEDDKDIAEMISYNLRKEGYTALSAERGDEAVDRVRRERPCLIILDVMLPGADGLEVCKALRSSQETAEVPIIMLTAKSQESDKVLGLELGADDYMTKPFSPRELIARINAVLRRHAAGTSGSVIERGAIVIDKAKHKVILAGKRILLTTTEFKLLDFLARRPGAVVSREEILNHVLGYDSDVYDRTVDAHIKSLRKKLGSAKDYIETVRGAGYSFREMDE